VTAAARPQLTAGQGGVDGGRPLVHAALQQPAGQAGGQVGGVGHGRTGPPAGPGVTGPAAAVPHPLQRPLERLGHGQADHHPGRVEGGRGPLHRRAGHAGAQVDDPVPAGAQQDHQQHGPQLVLLVRAAADQHGTADGRRQPVEQAQGLAAQEVGGEVLDLHQRAVPAGAVGAGRDDGRRDQAAGHALDAEQRLGGGEGALGLGLVVGAEGVDQPGQQPPRVVVLDVRGRAEQAGGLRRRHALDPAPVEEPDHGHVLVGVEALAGRRARRPRPAVAPLPRPQGAGRDAGHPLDGGDPVPGYLVVGLRRRLLALSRHGFLPPTRAARHRGCRSRWRPPAQSGTSK